MGYPHFGGSLKPLILLGLGITFFFSSKILYAIMLLTEGDFNDMTDILIHTTGGHQVTCVPNAFIDKYMQDANGEFVKIYLYLLRMLSQGEVNFCLSSMADKFNYTESDVRRGLSYWEKMHLLLMEQDDSGNLTGICLLEPEAPTTASVPIEKPKNPKTVSQYTPEEICAFREQGSVKELIMVSETYIGHPLSMTDMNTILFWYDSLHFSTEMIEFLVEYCVEKGHGSIHYMNKVAMNWSAEGISTLEEAKSTANIHSQSYYAVMKAFGISGRNLVSSEISFIDKWTNQYGFSLDIITEACSRTIRNIGKASFDYADTILTSWHKKGILHLEDISSLDKAHNSGKSTTQPKTVRTSNNRFHNFEQRNYDDDFYETLEQQLLRK